MIKINYMSTLFVGIDVNSKSNAVYAMDFDERLLAKNQLYTGRQLDAELNSESN